MGCSSERGLGITGDIRGGSGMVDMVDADGAGIMTAGGTTDITLADIVAVGDMMATREAMPMKDMAEAMLMKDMAEPASDIEVERASAAEKAFMEEAGSTA